MRSRFVTDDLSISRIILGTANYGTGIRNEEAFRQFDAYFSNGGRTFDTARVYGQWAEGGDGASERTIGKWLESNGLRNQVVISTKGAHPDIITREPRVRPELIRKDLNESLDFLRTDYVDLYFLHRDDVSVPVSEIMDALHESVEAGKIRTLGASNWTTERIQEANEYALKNGKTPFSVSQIEWSYAKLEKQIYGSNDTTQFMNPSNYGWYSERNFPVMAYSSQAGGFFTKVFSAPERITGTFSEVYGTSVNFKRAERAKMVAEKRGVSVAQITLAALLSDPLAPCAIIGASRVSQLEDSLIAEKIVLTTEEIAFLFNDNL